MRTIASSVDPVVPAIPVDGLRTLPTLLHALQDSPPPGPVLSIYLDTAPTRVMAGGHLLALRAGVKRLRAAEAGTSPEVGKAFEEIVARIERYLTQTERFDHPAWACFASSDHRFFYATPLPHTVADEVIWSEKPAIAPLEQALDEHERVAVVLFDSEQTRLYTMYLGEIEHVATFSDHVPQKHHGGGWLALEEGRHARHREVSLLRHAERTIVEVLRELRVHPFDRLIIAGPDEPRSFLIHHLPAVLSHRLAGVTKIELFATQDEVRRLAQVIAEQAERDAELAEVDQLINAATTRRTTLGVESVLAALADLSVQRLLIASDFAATGAKCARCERLSLGGRCPICGGEMMPLEDLREEIIASARAGGASVEMVSGEANERLMAVGNLGAWTRFS